MRTVIRNCGLLLASIGFCFATAGPADAGVTSVTVSHAEPYGVGNYVYAEARMNGTVHRDDGSTGAYSVPVVIIYPASGGNGVGVVDWLNSVFYHFFGLIPAEEFILPLARLSTDNYLFENGYTYIGVQWNKTVTDLFGASAPDDGQSHNHLVFGTIERGTDAWQILRDGAAFLRDPSAMQGGPAGVDTVLSFGYSQTAALQFEMLGHGHNHNADGSVAYDAHFASMTGQICFSRTDEAPFFGGYGPCTADPTGGDEPVVVLASDTDLVLLGAYFSRNPGVANWRQYEVAGVSHIPSGVIPLTDVQNPADPKPVFRAVFANLVSWVEDGLAAPASRFMDGSVDGEGNFIFQYDSENNPTGGLRLPHMRQAIDGKAAGAPLGVYGPVNLAGLDPLNQFVLFSGTFEAFSDAYLAQIYPSHGDYVSRVVRVAERLLADRYILAEDKERYAQGAAASTIGN